MFKVQFRKKIPPNTQYSETYPEQYPPHYQEEEPFYEYGQESPYTTQEFSTCLFCGDLVTGSHLSITTKSGEHLLHPSCIISSFALIINGFSMFTSFLFRKKHFKERK